MVYNLQISLYLGTYFIFSGEKYHWQVFLNREDGSVNFEVPWADYKAGFGDPSGEFWLGLDNIHTMTGASSHSLRVDIEDWTGNTSVALYSLFSVGPEFVNYRLYVAGFDTVNSTAGDSLINPADQANKRLSGMNFSTIDVDNDIGGADCAGNFRSGFWFGGCAVCNPTGLYNIAGPQINMYGITWHSVYDNWYTFKKFKMSIKPNL